MRISLQKSDFLNKLLPAMGTISNKNTISSIEGVLIETVDDETVRLSTYDMNKGVRCLIHGVRVEKPGCYIINAQRLCQTVRVLPDDEFTIDVDDNCNCTVSSDASSFSMFAMKGDEFPNLPELTSERGFTVSGAVLKKMIGKVSHSIAEQDNRIMLCGAFFKVTDSGLDVISCDSFTLSVCRMNCAIEKIGTEEGMSFIMPGHALSELVKVLPDGDETVTCYLSRKHAIVHFEDVTFFSRTIDSEYINYERIMPKDNDISVVVDRERFMDGLERANIVAEEKIQGSGKSFVKINLDGQYLTLSSKSANGKVSDEMNCVHEGSDIEIGFNCRYLINSVRVTEGENIKMTMKSATQAITIEPAEALDDFNFYYMILPVRMNG